MQRVLSDRHRPAPISSHLMISQDPQRKTTSTPNRYETCLQEFKVPAFGFSHFCSFIPQFLQKHCSVELEIYALPQVTVDNSSDRRFSSMKESSKKCSIKGPAGIYHGIQQPVHRVVGARDMTARAPLLSSIPTPPFPSAPFLPSGESDSRIAWILCVCMLRRTGSCNLPRKITWARTRRTLIRGGLDFLIWALLGA